MKSRRKTFLLYAGIFLVGCVLLFLLRVLVQEILKGYAIAWTGFGDYVSPKGDFVRGKTLWDWLDLLIIPLFLAGWAFISSVSERFIADRSEKERRRREFDIARDNQHETALQAYIDQMSELLLKESLRTTDIDEVRDVARTRTLSVLRALDSKRKGYVVKFLHESQLVLEGETKISLDGADLRNADLSNEYLGRVNLFGTLLDNANFQFAIVDNAKLERARLVRANLSNAHLSKSNMVLADLRGANLQNADLIEADLRGADLRDANIEGALLGKTNLDGTTMPNGAKGVGIYPFDTPQDESE